MHQNTTSDLPESDAEPTCGSALRVHAACGGGEGWGGGLFLVREQTSIQLCNEDYKLLPHAIKELSLAVCDPSGK